MQSKSINRPFSLIATLAFLGLAICVFTWGLQYKLSLYTPPQTASHQIPTAKLLSRDEQSGTPVSPLVLRTKTSTRVIYTVSASAYLIPMPALSVPTPPASGQREQRAGRSWQMRRAILRTCFVRPPPVIS